MSNKSRPPPIQNHLLAALPGRVYKRLLPHLESVPLHFMEVIYESGDAIEHVYFPHNGLISLLVVIADKMPREIGVIGNEGMSGTAVALGMNTTPIRALIRLPGNAMRMKAKALRDELKHGGAIQNVLQRYCHPLFTQVSQSAACVSSHAVGVVPQKRCLKIKSSDRLFLSRANQRNHLPEMFPREHHQALHKSGWQITLSLPKLSAAVQAAQGVSGLTLLHR